MRNRGTLRLLVGLVLVFTIVVAIGFTVLGVPHSSGIIYHVSTAGDDAGDGSAGKPWRTIQKAVDSATPRSIIVVGEGTYDPFKVSRPGLTITGEGNKSVTIHGQNNIRDVVLLAADNVTLSNVVVEGCTPRINQGASTADDSSGVRVGEDTHGVAVSGITVRDSHGVNPEGLPVGCYGIIVRNAINAVVDGNDVYHNAFGVAVVGGQNTRVTNNRIHDNDVLIKNTGDHHDDDFGAVAIGFIRISAGAMAEGNVIYRNQGLSLDYGTDGGAFDIYQSSNIVMRRNLMVNNDVVLETGTGPDHDCLNNVFTENIAIGKTSDHPMEHATGILLRCANNMSVTNNMLSNVDAWTFQITGGGNFGGTIAGMKITGNTIWQKSSPVYQLDMPALSLPITINDNTYHTATTFALDWKNEKLETLAQWQEATGFDSASTCDCVQP